MSSHHHYPYKILSTRHCYNNKDISIKLSLTCVKCRLRDSIKGTKKMILKDLKILYTGHWHNILLFSLFGSCYCFFTDMHVVWEVSELICFVQFPYGCCLCVDDDHRPENVKKILTNSLTTCYISYELRCGEKFDLSFCSLKSNSIILSNKCTYCVTVSTL